MGKKQILALILAALLAGCSLPAGPGSTESPPPASTSSLAEPEPPPPQAAEPSVQPEEPSPEPAAPRWDAEEPHPYLRQLAEETAAALMTPGMSEHDRTKAAFDYMIRHTSMADPVGLELWRVHGGGEEPVSFVEQRALSPLRFGVGMCEDYAAALTLLLRAMGLEARYVPGLTYSAEGNLVDHAWTMVRIDGTWYHLDSQLEDNISRRGAVRYKYFLRGDGTLSVSHRWGQNLIDSGLLTPEQNREIEENWLTPACPADYPTPPRSVFEEPEPPDLALLAREAEGEMAAWEAQNGPLPPMTLNTVPPVFGLDGFGPADEG